MNQNRAFSFQIFMFGFIFDCCLTALFLPNAIFDLVLEKVDIEVGRFQDLSVKLRQKWIYLFLVFWILFLKFSFKGENDKVHPQVAEDLDIYWIRHLPCLLRNFSLVFIFFNWQVSSRFISFFPRPFFMKHFQPPYYTSNPPFSKINLSVKTMCFIPLPCHST